MSVNQTIPRIDIDIPNERAWPDLISPNGTGLLLVRFIIGSMSLSYHMLIALEPPAVRYPPTRVMSDASSVWPKAGLVSDIRS